MPRLALPNRAFSIKKCCTCLTICPGTAKPCLGDSFPALLVCLRRGGVLPRPRAGQSPAPTHPMIRFRRGRCPHRPAVPAAKLSVGAGFSCPPSCQPTDGHCRGRQSGHFLEIASLHPPLAALRRFPHPVLTGKPCPARPPHTAVLRFSPARGRCSTITAQSSPSPLRHRDSSNISAASSRASVPVKPASRFSSHSSQL